MDIDLLEDFVFSPPPPSNDINTNADFFVQHFWGEKNQGFDVLYHNMKHGQVSVKALQDFIRESAASQDVYAKHLTKLAKQAANSSTLGTFAPMFEVFRAMAEKLSSCHMDVVYKLQDVVKDLSKYLEEQKVKHKQVKEEVNATASTLQQLQAISISVQKNKEKYHLLCAEAERLKRTGGISKDCEKAETKMKKSGEEYKNLVGKYATLRNDYEQKMTESAKKFQEIEVAHLKQMRNILETYILSFENANVLVGQVHQEFRRQISENTIDSLLRKFSESKGTGIAKPGPLVFEEYDGSTPPSSTDTNQPDMGITEDRPPPPSKLSIRPHLPFRRKKPRKSTKESGSGSKEVAKEADANSTDSPDKDVALNVDEEGYTIRPETPRKESQDTWGFSSNDDDSDSDADDKTMKIHVKINPQDAKSNATNGGNLDALNAISKTLILSTSSTLAGPKKITRRKSDRSDLSSKSFKTLQATLIKQTESLPEESGSERYTDLFTCHSTGKVSKGTAGGGSNSEESFRKPSSSSDAVNRNVPSKKSGSVLVKSEFSWDGRPVSNTWLTFSDMRAAPYNSNISFSDFKAKADDSASQLPSSKSKPSTNEDILNLFDSQSNGSTMQTESAPDVTSVSGTLFPANFQAQANSPSGGAIPQSSSMNNLFVMSSSKDVVNEEKTSNSVLEGQDSAGLIGNAPSTTTGLIGNVPSTTTSLIGNVPSTRPADLFLNGEAKPANGTAFASNDSWSTLSSTAGTPIDHFVPSRGPSPVPLMQGDPIPIAVAFTETVNAYFKGTGGDRCFLKLSGEVQMSFPSGIVRSFTANPDPPTLSFVIKETNEVSDLSSRHNFLLADTSQHSPSQRRFKFDTNSLSAHIKKMIESNPAAPFYNISLLTYQFNSQSGHSMSPLHLTVAWKCDVDATELTITYKYNNAATSSPLNHVRVIVPVNGGVTNHQSEPPAQWIADKNRLEWNLSTPISSSSPSGSLKSRLTLASGPSSAVPLAVQFVGEGSIPSRTDFELSCTGYRLSLIKKRFMSGKYMIDPN